MVLAVLVTEEAKEVVVVVMEEEFVGAVVKAVVAGGEEVEELSLLQGRQRAKRREKERFRSWGLAEGGTVKR